MPPAGRWCSGPIESALARADGAHPELGRHLVQSIRTGMFCVYLPGPHLPAPWTLAGPPGPTS